MARIGFCGGSYTAQSILADCQRTLNLFPEINESGDGVSAKWLSPTPGLKVLVTLDGPPRGMFEFNGRCFAAGKFNFYEILPTFAASGALVSATASVLNSGTPLANDFLPVSIAANENQLLIASGGFVYVYYLNAMADSVTGNNIPAGTFTQVPQSAFTLASGNAPVKQVLFANSYFLALIANSQSVQVSNLLDGANWIPGGSIVGGVYTGGVATQLTVSLFADNVISMAADHLYVWLFGRKQSIPYLASGDLNIFSPVTGYLLEQGSLATFATVNLDNSIFWLGLDSRGSLMAWRMNGITPMRVSNHANEFIWQNYNKATDAVGYSYQDGGHSFWVIRFPSANNGNGATWVFDAATALWHERDFLNTQTGQSLAHPSTCHAFAFGQHLVGDWNTANVYWQDLSWLDNAGVPIERLRRAPHLTLEQEWIRHDRFELQIENGVGWASTDPNHNLGGAGQPPFVGLRYSDDGGRTWSNMQWRSFGFMGQYKARAYWTRLGRARDRVYEISCSEPVPVRIIDAFVNGSPNFEPTERLVHQFRKSA